MKKLVLSILTILTLVQFSCKKEESEPSFAFEKSGYFVSSDKSFEEGDTVFIAATAKIGTSGELLESYFVTLDGTYLINETALKGRKKIRFTDTVIVIVPPTRSQPYNYHFNVIPADGQIASLTLNITSLPSNGLDIHTYPAITLGNQANTIDPSFINAAKKTVFGSSAAGEFSNQIDFAYLYNASDFATFASPSDALAQSTYPDIATWTTKKETLFKLTTLTAADFDAIQGDFAILNAYTTGTSKITNVSANQVIAFKTAGNKTGLIKINSVDGADASTGKITFDIKVQK